MRFIHRDPKDPTKILGHYANPQPGYAEEAVDDDHPELVAWKAAREERRRKAFAEEGTAATQRRIAELERLVRHLQDELKKRA